MAADKIIEQIYADLKDSACAPAGIFTANAAWLLLAAIAFNHSQADQEPPWNTTGSEACRPGTPTTP